MSEAKKATMETVGSVSGGASSARGSCYRSDCTNDHHLSHCSGGLLTLTEFIGKTTEMNSNIFDVGAGRGARLLSTQDKLSEFASINNLEGH